MKLVPVTQESIVNKAYQPTKLQIILDEFMKNENVAVKCILEEGEYKSVSSARNSFRGAIRRFKYPVIARVIEGELYLIKTASVTTIQNSLVNKTSK